MDERLTYVAPHGRHASIEIIIGVGCSEGIGQHELTSRFEEVQDHLGRELERAIWCVAGVVALDEVAIMEHGTSVAYPVSVNGRMYSCPDEFHAAIKMETAKRIGSIVHDSIGRAFTLDPWVAVFRPQPEGDDSSAEELGEIPPSYWG
jgi:hypothetical protein